MGSPSVLDFAQGTCAKHQKLNFTSRRQAMAAIEGIRADGKFDGGLSGEVTPYRCDLNEDYWHFGRTPARPTPPLKGPLTYKVQEKTGPLELPSPEDKQDSMTTALLPAPSTSTTDVEALLVAAEASDWAPALGLAKQLREVQAEMVELRARESQLIAELVQEAQTSERQRALLANIEQMRAQLDAMLTEYNALRREPEPARVVAEPVVVAVVEPQPEPEPQVMSAPSFVLFSSSESHVHPASNQSAIRDWCKAQDPPVPCSERGAIPRNARAAYERAHPNG